MSKKRRGEEDCKLVVTSDCKCGQHCLRTFSLQTVMTIRSVLWSMVVNDQNEHILKTLTKHAVHKYDPIAKRWLIPQLHLIPADLLDEVNTPPSILVGGADAEDDAQTALEHQHAERQSKECDREVRNRWHRTHQPSLLTDHVPDALGCVQIGALQPEQPKI
jgi:hypothetical protein